LHRDGYGRAEGRFDEHGNLIDRTLFDTRGHASPMRTVIVFVRTDGPGALLGLRPGDILATYGGQPVVNSLRAPALPETGSRGPWDQGAGTGAPGQAGDGASAHRRRLGCAISRRAGATTWENQENGTA
jgi:hypothetical protein